MSDETQDPYGLDPYPEIETTGIVEKLEFGKPWDDGNQPVNLTVSFTDSQGYPHNERAGAGTFHPERMKKGADNSDLEPNQLQALMISKRRLIDLATALGTTVKDLYETPESVEGKYLGFKLGPHYKKKDQPDYKKFFKATQ